MTYRFGKRPARRDPRTLRMGDYLPATLPPIPSAIDWLGKVPDWGMLGNDSVGNCTCAGAGHQIELWTSQASTEATLSTPQILAVYSAITGYDPSKPDTDQGAVEIDVLNYWRQTGIAGHQIAAYVQVDPANQAHVQAAIALFGGLYIGVQLPPLALQQFEAGSDWSDTTQDGQDGHCVILGAYDAAGLTCVTWGMQQKMSWGWVEKYCDEAYAPLSFDWFAATGLSPSAFDLGQLRVDLAAVSK